MKLLRALHLGMCFGVRDAIELALKQSAHGSVSVLGELVHNESVNRTLQAHGVVVRQNLSEVTTPTVMVTAHGTSQRTIRAIEATGRHLVEATCPLVVSAHRVLSELVAAGCHPVIIGKRDHVEVRGMTGDLKEFDVLLTIEDLEALEERPLFGVVAQTTQPIERVHAFVTAMRERFPSSEIRFKDTVCQPTKQRQAAAIDLAKKCDVVVVIGGVHSNNTRELAETCRRHCDRVHQVQDQHDLKREWFYNAQVVGITAGTSTPDDVINLVDQELTRMAEESIGCSCNNSESTRQDL